MGSIYTGPEGLSVGGRMGSKKKGALRAKRAPGARKPRPVVQRGWAILGVHGFYIGWEMTKKSAIESHCSSLWVTWDYCQRKGDRCVPVEIREVSKPSQRRKGESRG